MAERTRRRVAICGSTGSIGRQALDVIRAAGSSFELVAIGASRSVDLLAAQAAEFSPRLVALADDTGAADLASRLPSSSELRTGAGSLTSLCEEEDVDVVLNAVVGFAGLEVTIRALECGKRLALANKESLIAGAPVVQVARRTPGAEILPVDSEHCAIHQCLGANGGRVDEEVGRLILTASGGPFRGRKREELEDATVAEALAHPTWAMGPKITVDSSTLMNKGLEVLEASELFAVPSERIEVVVHPQSIIHSMVEYRDGATLAQLSRPDMRLPIGYCLGYPERLAHAYGPIDWSTLSRLDFEQPDTKTFRCLALAFEAARIGGAAPAWLNAANEVAVAAFLEGRIGWCQIDEVIAETLDSFEQSDLEAPGDVVAADRAARTVAGRATERRGRLA